MARTPRRKKGQELPDNIAALVGALEFVSPAQAEEGSVQQQYCVVRNRMIVANNGLYTLGAPIPDDVTAAVHTRRFLAALLKCDASVAITVKSNGWIAVKSGKFTANVSTIAIDEIPTIAPDPAVCGISPAVKDALAKVAHVAKENAPRVVFASVLLRENTALATTGTVLLEAWHGHSLPTMAIPKVAVDRLLRIEKPLAGFGYSDGRSATFYFDDGSYLCTRLYPDAWPNVDSLLNQPSNPVPMPAGFWQAIDGIGDFAERNSGFVIFGDGIVHTAIEPSAGATYELPSFGIVGKAFDVDLLDVIRPYAESADFITNSDRVFFFGPSQKVRGIIMFGRPH